MLLWELYQEEDSSIIRSEGNDYSVNKLLRIIKNVKTQ
jgi:hypothetical protein